MGIVGLFQPPITIGLFPFLQSAARDQDRKEEICPAHVGARKSAVRSNEWRHSKDSRWTQPRGTAKIVCCLQQASKILRRPPRDSLAAASAHVPLTGGEAAEPGTAAEARKATTGPRPGRNRCRAPPTTSAVVESRERRPSQTLPGCFARRRCSRDSPDSSKSRPVPFARAHRSRASIIASCPVLSRFRSVTLASCLAPCYPSQA